jgi:hypothetical protein
MDSEPVLDPISINGKRKFCDEEGCSEETDHLSLIKCYRHSGRFHQNKRCNVAGCDKWIFSNYRCKEHGGVTKQDIRRCKHGKRDTVKLALSAVCDPVSPVMVTLDPADRSKLAVSETVNVLVAPDAGVLCPIDFRLKLGTSTVSGSAPLATPYRAFPGLSIATVAIEPTLLPLPSSISADTLTIGETCAESGFVKANVTSHAKTPDAAVNTSCPGVCVHAPLVPNRSDVEEPVLDPISINGKRKFCDEEGCSEETDHLSLIKCYRHSGRFHQNKRCNVAGCDKWIISNYRCKEHGGVTKQDIRRCKHGKKKANCGECGTKRKRRGCLECKDWPDWRLGLPHYDNMCFRCYARKFPGCKKVRVEDTVKAYINSHFAGFIHDQRWPTAHCDCTLLRRVDHRSVVGNTLLCIETDEHHHIYYDKDDEEARYHDVLLGWGGKLCFIRFNPDDEGPPLEERLERLHAEMLRHIGRLERGENSAYLEVWHLYYPEGTPDYYEEALKPEWLEDVGGTLEQK